MLEIVGDEPVFETGLLLADHVDERDVRQFLEPRVDASILTVENVARLLGQGR